VTNFLILQWQPYWDLVESFQKNFQTLSASTLICPTTGPLKICLTKCSTQFFLNLPNHPKAEWWHIEEDIDGNADTTKSNYRKPRAHRANRLKSGVCAVAAFI